MSSVKKPYKNMGQFHKHKNGKLWCANRSYFAWLCKMLIWRRSIPSGNFCQINFFSFSGCQRFSIKLFFGFVDFENFFCAIFCFCRFWKLYQTFIQTKKGWKWIRHLLTAPRNPGSKRVGGCELFCGFVYFEGVQQVE